MTPTEELQELFDDCHRVALEKGWWDRYKLPLSVDQAAAKLVLIGTEVREAKQTVRSGELFDRVRADGKPEGLPSELSDVGIRNADLAGFVGARIHLCSGAHEPDSFSELLELSFKDYRATRIERELEAVHPGSLIPEKLAALGCIDEEIALAVESLRVGGVDTLPASLTFIAQSTFVMADRMGIDLIAAIQHKHAFNKTRPHRHGGKAL